MDAIEAHLTPGVMLVSLVYSILGMIFLMVAYKIFDLVNALEFTKELESNPQEAVFK